MLFELTSQKSLEAIDRDLREAAARHKFGVIAVHNLKETMANKGVAFEGECLIYEICNPHQAKRVLEANGAVSAALPCRISVYRTEGGYKLVTLLPSALMQIFGDAQLAPAAQEVEADILAMMREAA
jgi:uncharacterized protein (DUF302 family)